MPAPRKMALKGESFSKNITKRGLVSNEEKKDGYAVGPGMLAFFLFVVVGSAVLQIIMAAQRGHP